MQSETMKFDPATGEPRPYPSHAEQWRLWHGYGCAWLFNPWSGERRDARDVGSDTNGRLIAPHGTLGSDLGVAGVPDNTANTRLDDTAAAIDAARAARAPADSVTVPAGGAVAEPEFDDCPASPTGKHSASWFANDDCEHCKSGAQPDAPLLYTPTSPAQAADSVLEDAARLERERICAAIKAEDDYCVDHGDYMLDSDDCIKIVRGEWVRPDFSVTAARKQGANHD